MTSDNGKMEASRSSAGTRISFTVTGYVPPTQNEMKGIHWSALSREKKRAGIFLMHALKSRSLYIQCGHAIMTDTALNICKIGSSKLESFRATDGKPYLAGSCPERLSRKKKSARKLKLKSSVDKIL